VRVWGDERRRELLGFEDEKRSYLSIWVNGQGQRFSEDGCLIRFEEVWLYVTLPSK
jgi:hypothetical protein